ncbi:MAG TPA: hypothetical protein VKA40_05850 [Nitrososphaera sp.]|nr:hypothetical protein [Nitrososphaera sp.]
MPPSPGLFGLFDWSQGQLSLSWYLYIHDTLVPPTVTPSSNSPSPPLVALPPVISLGVSVSLPCMTYTAPS